MTRIDPEQRKQYNKQYNKEYRQRRDVKQKDIEGKNPKKCVWLWCRIYE